ISDVGIKLAKPDGWALPEVKVANTVVNEWEELTFDFSTHHQEGYDQIVVFPDFNLDGRTQDNLVYLDNITFSPQMLPTEPTVAAPVPTQDEADVVSLFSNAYTNVTVDTWSAEWDAADVADAQVVGDDVKLYTNLTFAGVEFTSAPVDASEMTHFHLDLWTPDPTAAPAVFKVKLVDFGADGAFGGGDDTEHELEFTDPPLMTGSWVSIDVPMADFAGLSEQAHLAQMIITSDPNTVYVDNVYFYAEEVVLPGPHAPVDFEVGGHGADWTWTVEENATNPALEVIANPVSGGINTSATVGRFTALQAGQPWALFYTDDIGEFTFDTTNALVKIMVHKPIVSNFAIKLEGASPPIEIQIPNTVTNDWEELSFNFADQIGNSYNRIVIIPDFDMGGRTQDNIIHIDNITFSSSQEEPLPGLFFSEYSEGSEGSNKYVEIYNPTGVDVDLSSYSVQGTNNGTAWGDGGDRDTTLSGILAAGDVFIIAPDQANADILALANMILEYESPVHYNGDDGIALLKDGLIIDAIGVENVDPGDGWDVAGVAEATQDHTLIRKNEVMFGNIGNWEMSAGTDSLDSQWLVADPATNDYTPPTLGWHITPPPAVPVVAAPIPDVNADQVLSIFSGAYTDLAETNFNPDWGQSTVVSNEEVAGDNTLKYVDLNYQGTNLGGAEGVDQDVTGYEYIHVDFWTPNATALNFFLISRTTGEQVFALPVATEEWVSVDIPLSHFTDLGLGLSDIFQFKVDGGDGSTIVYFDNWYFYTTVVSVEDLAMLPEESVLEQNFPNPFNPSTTLRYGIPEESAVSMIIYDIRGNVVRTMQSGSKPAGWYELEWNGLDNAGIPVSTGLYLTRLQVGTYTQTIKMLYLK
ncbi:MAG: lamin tail domain-containing protein, partial [Candidatus Marinimicrobia bacterium]|nr:lamin tail domain-containing protein [Candidatus Neomarinimicrobiota bacterium]